MSDASKVLLPFSPEVANRRRTLEEGCRTLTLEIIDLDLQELRRLAQDDEMFSRVVTIELLRQKMESADFSDPMVIGRLGLIADYSGPNLRHRFSPSIRQEITTRLEGIRSQMLEYVEVTVTEVKRLALESDGSESLTLAVAAALMSGLKTADAGMLKNLVDFYKRAASSEAKQQSERN